MTLKHDASMYDFAERWITNKHEPPMALLDPMVVELADRIAEAMVDYLAEHEDALAPYLRGGK